MISRKYSELLPQYLAGSNIRRHSEILEEMDKQIDDKLDILSNAYNLQRPILIERVQEEAGKCTVNIHVNTKYSIKTIKIGSTIEASYTEDDAVSRTVITKEYTDVIPPVMPDLVVTVETYDDRVYVKGYPENDTIQNNECDHDEFLDITGRLLGIPRRTYLDPNRGQDADAFKNNYPAYFTKSMLQSTGIATEDDYYYSQRLQKFGDGLVSGKGLLSLMADVLYEWDTSSVVHVKNRSTYLYDSLDDVVGDTSEYDILEMARPLYDNIDYSNLQEVLREYYPITRILFALTRKYIEWFIQDFRVYNGRLLFTAYTEYSEDDTSEDVYKCTFLADYFNYKDSIVVSEGHATGMNAVWTGNIRIDWPVLLFARIRYRQMYECKNGNATDNITYNILTGTDCGDMRGISVLLQENEEDDNWNIEDWVTRLGSGGIPPLEESSTAGTVINLGSECNTYLTPLPDCDWCVHLNLSEEDGVGDLAPVFVVSYLNNADGRMEMTISADLIVTMKEYNPDGSVARTSTLDELFSGLDDIVPLVVERRGNSITFAYWNTGGTLTRHTRTYTSLSVNGALYFHTYQNRILLHSHNRYAIGEYNSDRADLQIMNTEDWTVIPHPTLPTTANVFSDEGVLSLGKRQSTLYPINREKQYNILLYQSTDVLYIGVGYLTGGTSSVMYLNANVFNELQRNSVNMYVLTFEEDGVYLALGSEKLRITTRTSDTHIYLYTSQDGYNQKLLALTEQTPAGGGGN